MEYPIRVAQIVGNMSNGGVETVILNYYREIDKSKIQFDFFVNETSKHVRKDEIESLGGHVYFLPSYKHPISYKKKLYQILSENRYQIVHSHINTLSILPLRVAKKAKIGIRIAHSHSTANGAEFFQKIIKNCLRLFSKKYATNYAACSFHAGNWLFGQKAFQNGIVLANAIDLTKFTYSLTNRISVREKYHISNDTFVVGHVGRFVKVKNHKYLIAIFRELLKKRPNSLLVLIGDGNLEKQIKDRCLRCGIANKTLFLESQDDVSSFYSAMDAFCFPSFSEGLGLTLVEAQANGLPCAVSNAIPKEAYLTNLVTGFPLAKQNKKDWVSFLSSCPVRKNVSSYFSILASKGYSISDASKHLEDYYLALLKDEVTHN